jgi:hypothetical protein
VRVTVYRITADIVLLGDARRADPVDECLFDVGSLYVRADTALVFMPAAADRILAGIALLFLRAHG